MLPLSKTNTFIKHKIKDLIYKSNNKVCTFGQLITSHRTFFLIYSESTSVRHLRDDTLPKKFLERTITPGEK